ncbi:MAG TPA: hypothetical protein VK853_00920 [Ilumatobacteraceae bacterium]|nr:hypothetical protein [Ilumatobacteraceae bacterium]
MSVDTNVKGKNLAPYRRLRHGRFQILISPPLIGLAESMRVVTKGRLTKSLAVEFRAAGGDESCDL